MSSPEVLQPTVDFLAKLAQGGPVLEFAVGTGRVALPLAERGLEVEGVDLSPHMVEQLRAKDRSDRVAATVGDMTTVDLKRTFRLVYLVFNTIMNVTAQDEQVDTFCNAARHLESGGTFVLEVVVARGGMPTPQVSAMSDDHVGIDTTDDPIRQLSSSHHWYAIDGRLVRQTHSFRYIFPSELDLMARIAGLRLEQRWADWRRAEFNAASTSQIVVYKKP